MQCVNQQANKFYRTFVLLLSLSTNTW